MNQKTFHLAVIGDPISHSLSPQICLTEDPFARKNIFSFGFYKEDYLRGYFAKIIPPETPNGEWQIHTYDSNEVPIDGEIITETQFTLTFKVNNQKAPNDKVVFHYDVTNQSIQIASHETNKTIPQEKIVQLNDHYWLIKAHAPLLDRDHFFVIDPQLSFCAFLPKDEYNTVLPPDFRITSKVIRGLELKRVPSSRSKEIGDEIEITFQTSDKTTALHMTVLFLHNNRMMFKPGEILVEYNGDLYEGTFAFFEMRKNPSTQNKYPTYMIEVPALSWLGVISYENEQFTGLHDVSALAWSSVHIEDDENALLEKTRHQIFNLLQIEKELADVSGIERLEKEKPTSITHAIEARNATLGFRLLLRENMLQGQINYQNAINEVLQQQIDDENKSIEQKQKREKRRQILLQKIEEKRVEFQRDHEKAVRNAKGKPLIPLAKLRELKATLEPILNDVDRFNNPKDPLYDPIVAQALRDLIKFRRDWLNAEFKKYPSKKERISRELTQLTPKASSVGLKTKF